MATSSGGKKGSRKIGRDKVKCALYRSHKTREKNKIKRILRAHGNKGYDIAYAYADKHGLTTYLKTLLNRKNANG